MEQNTVLYQYQGELSTEELFYNFAKRYSWSSYDKPSKTMKSIQFKSVTMTKSMRRYYIKARIKGNYSYLLMPFNTKVSEELDKEALFRYIPECDSCIYCAYHSTTALLVNASAGIGFAQPTLLEISETDKDFLMKGIKKSIYELAKDSTKVNRDWEEFDGTIEFMFVAAVDAPYIFFNEWSTSLVIDFPNDKARQIIEQEWGQKWGAKEIAKVRKLFEKKISKCGVKEETLDYYRAFSTVTALLHDLSIGD